MVCGGSDGGIISGADVDGYFCGSDGDGDGGSGEAGIVSGGEGSYGGCGD